jgi:hypothetical protein
MRFGSIRSSVLLAGFTASLCVIAAPSVSETIRIAPIPGQSASDQLDAALARARTSDGSTILLAPGIYRLARPLKITGADSGLQGAPLRIVGEPGGPVILTGGGPMDPAKITAALASLIPGAARLHVRAYQLPPAVVQAFAKEKPQAAGTAVWLTEGDRPLMLAGWPSSSYSLQAITAPQKAPVAPVVDITHDQAVRWAKEPALRGEGFWTSDWYFAWNWVQQVDPATNVVRMARFSLPYSEAKHRRFKITNVFGEINGPGDYAIDPQSGVLIVWPFDNDPVELTAIDNIVQIDGAHDIAIDGIAMRAARKDAVTINGSSRITLANSYLGLAGGGGVTVTDGTNVAIYRSVVSDTAEEGVRMAGGDSVRLTPGNDSISDSIVRRTGLLGSRSGMVITGVGQTVSGNYIADITKAGIQYGGNDHHITGNEITAVNQEMGDFGALYTYGNLTARGTVIEQNYVHDIQSKPGLHRNVAVYLDGFTSGITVRRNLFVDTPRVIWVNSGSDNVVANNLFVRPSESPIEISDRAFDWAKGRSAKIAQNSLSKASPAILQRYGEAAVNRTAQNNGSPSDNVIGTNIVIDGPDAAIAPQVAQRQKVSPQISMSGGNASTPVAIGRIAASRGGDFGINFAGMDRRQALAGLRYAAAGGRTVAPPPAAASPAYPREKQTPLQRIRDQMDALKKRQQ